MEVIELKRYSITQPDSKLLKKLTYLLGFHDATHQCSAFQVRARTETHCNNVQFRHLVKNALRRPLSVLLASLAIRYNDFLDEFPVGALEFNMVLKNKLNSAALEITSVRTSLKYGLKYP